MAEILDTVRWQPQPGDFWGHLRDPAMLNPRCDLCHRPLGAGRAWIYRSPRGRRSRGQVWLCEGCHVSIQFARRRTP